MSTAFETIAKTQRQGKLVVHHELSRTQPKLERKCGNVGVDALAVVWCKKWYLTSMTVPKKNDICNRTLIILQGFFFITVLSDAKTISVSKNITETMITEIIDSKTFNLHHVQSVIILTTMVCQRLAQRQERVNRMFQGHYSCSLHRNRESEGSTSQLPLMPGAPRPGARVWLSRAGRLMRADTLEPLIEAAACSRIPARKHLKKLSQTGAHSTGDSFRDQTWQARIPENLQGHARVRHRCG